MGAGKTIALDVQFRQAIVFLLCGHRGSFGILVADTNQAAAGARNCPASSPYWIAFELVIDTGQRLVFGS